MTKDEDKEQNEHQILMREIESETSQKIILRASEKDDEYKQCIVRRYIEYDGGRFMYKQMESIEEERDQREMINNIIKGKRIDEPKSWMSDRNTKGTTRDMSKDKQHNSAHKRWESMHKWDKYQNQTGLSIFPDDDDLGEPEGEEDDLADDHTEEGVTLANGMMPRRSIRLHRRESNGYIHGWSPPTVTKV